MKRDTRVKKVRRFNDMVYQCLFEEVPFNVAVIDREYNIVHANGNFTEKFGKWQGKKCYTVYKKLHQPCDECPSEAVFETGQVKVADAVGIDKDGRQTHYVGHVAPLRTTPDGPVDFVMEMTRTITGTKSWQQEYQVLFDRIPCYITVIDRDYRIVRANEAFRNSFGDVLDKHCYEVFKKRTTKCRNCPARKTFRDGNVHRSNQKGTGKKGQDIHYAVTASPLMRSGDDVAHIIEIATDVTALKKLEHDVLEAERLGAVGQTVAGLAHSIKNILMGLEGGMYIAARGLKLENNEMISEGWEMLERNLTKTTSLVRDFLSFAKGRLPSLKPVNPNDLVEEIIDLYGAIASESGIVLRAELDQQIKMAPLDARGIHTCLTNLVSNAIDACQMSRREKCEVVIRAEDHNGVLSFIVSDNGKGMDYDIKQRLFTTFFTTKGGQGTGLGLLTTRKIVKEHGGKITVKSSEGGGSCFTMAFPRNNLKALFHKDNTVE
ncbi:MAG: PAS domain-containing protein [candidate division Zixibacteria bacterium]|nr:PAS domain-containing protein [candidate division Zixibacteria bacterium]